MAEVAKNLKSRRVIGFTYHMTTGLTFENFYQRRSARGDCARAMPDLAYTNI